MRLQREILQYLSDGRFTLDTAGELQVFDSNAQPLDEGDPRAGTTLCVSDPWVLRRLEPNDALGLYDSTTRDVKAMSDEGFEDCLAVGNGQFYSPGTSAGGVLTKFTFDAAFSTYTAEDLTWTFGLFIGIEARPLAFPGYQMLVTNREPGDGANPTLYHPGSFDMAAQRFDELPAPTTGDLEPQFVFGDSAYWLEGRVLWRMDYGK